MGNRSAVQVEIQEMVPQGESQVSSIPLVQTEEDSQLPHTIAIPEIKIYCHIIPNSFKLQDQNIFEFIFDALADCKISITSYNLSQNFTETFLFSIGLNQSFTGWPLDFPSPEKTSTGPCKEFLLEIKIESFFTIKHSETSTVRLKKNLEKYEGKVSTQVLDYNGKTYDLKEVYGSPMDDENLECTVCIFNKRNTIVIPCHHMCLCEYCANILRAQSIKKCPMCRCGNFYLEAESLVKVNTE
jgi:Zinc finger, C3HC4 type (RING finger)